LQGDGEEAELQRPPLLTAATKRGASGLSQFALMMPFGSCICQATWRQPRAAAAGRTAEKPHIK